MNRPKLIGITGGIGSGKSTVCKIFEVLGLKVYYADDRAKYLMENNEEVINGVKSIFGDQAYSDNKLNRPFISQKAFGNKDLLEDLNEVVHPIVKKDFKDWVEDNSKQKCLVKEAALLIETGSYKELDALVVILASESTRISRVLARDPHRTEEEIKKIISEQLSDNERRSRADFIIENEGDRSLIKQVADIHSRLIVT